MDCLIENMQRVSSHIALCYVLHFQILSLLMVCMAICLSIELPTGKLFSSDHPVVGPTLTQTMCSFAHMECVGNFL